MDLALKARKVVEDDDSGSDTCFDGEDMKVAGNENMALAAKALKKRETTSQAPSEGTQKDMR